MKVWAARQGGTCSERCDLCVHVSVNQHAGDHRFNRDVGAELVELLAREATGEPWRIAGRDPGTLLPAPYGIERAAPAVRALR